MEISLLGPVIGASAMDAVVVEKEISRLPAVGHGFPQLLNHPSHRRIGCDRKMNDLPAAVVQDDEDIQRCEPNRVESGRRVTLPSPAPIRTVLDSFPITRLKPPARHRESATPGTITLWRSYAGRQLFLSRWAK